MKAYETAAERLKTYEQVKLRLLDAKKRNAIFFICNEIHFVIKHPDPLLSAPEDYPHEAHVGVLFPELWAAHHLNQLRRDFSEEDRAQPGSVAWYLVGAYKHRERVLNIAIAICREEVEHHRESKDRRKKQIGR